MKSSACTSSFCAICVPDCPAPRLTTSSRLTPIPALDQAIPRPTCIPNRFIPSIQTLFSNYRLLISLPLLLLLPLLLSAQDCPPARYRTLMRQADEAAAKGQYDMAINKLQSAKTCQPDSEAVVNVRMVEVFKEVNRQRELAIGNAKKANASAAINLGKTSIENLNKSYLLAQYAYKKNPSDPAGLGLLLKTYHEHSFEYQDKLIAPPFYQDIFKLPEGSTMYWADASTQANRLLCSDGNRIWIINSAGIVEFDLLLTQWGVSTILGLKLTPDGEHLILLHRAMEMVVALVYEIKSRDQTTIPLFSGNGATGLPVGVRGFDISPDGTLIAVATPDSVKVVEFNTGRPMGQIRIEGYNSDAYLNNESEPGPVTNLHFGNGNNQKMIITTAEAVKLWNLSLRAEPSELFKIKDSNLGLMDARYSPDDDYLVMLEYSDAPFFKFNGQFNGGRLVIARPAYDKKKILFRQPAAMPQAFKRICFLDKNTLTLGTNTDAIFLYRLKYANEQLDLVQMVQLDGHAHDVTFIAPGGGQHPGLFSFSPDNTVKYWPFREIPETYRRFPKAATLDFEDWESGTFSNDYTSVAWLISEGDLFSNQTKAIWAQVKDSLYRLPKLTASGMVRFAWNDNQELAVGFDDSIHVFRWPGPVRVARFGVPDMIRALRYEGNTLLILTNSSVLRCAANKPPVSVWAHPNLLELLGVSRQGNMALRVRDSLFIVSPQGVVLRYHPGLRGLTMAISNDFKLLAFGDLDDIFSGGIHLVNLSTGNRQLLSGHSDRITALAFSDDNRYLVSAADDRTWRMWSTATGEEIFRQPLSEIAILKFCKQGRALALYYRQRIDRISGVTNTVPVLRTMDISVEQIFNTVRNSNAYPLRQQQADLLRYGISN